MSTLGVDFQATPSMSGANSLGAALGGAMGGGPNSRDAINALKAKAYAESLAKHNQVYEQQAAKVGAETAALNEKAAREQQEFQATNDAGAAFADAQINRMPHPPLVLAPTEPAIVQYQSDVDAVRKAAPFVFQGGGNMNQRTEAMQKLLPGFVPPVPVGQQDPIFTPDKSAQIVPDPKAPGRYQQVPVTGAPGAAVTGPTGEKMTADQANAGNYATRMRTADAIISDPNIYRKNMGIPGFFNQMNDKIPVIGHGSTDAEYQQFDQAQRNFINSILRRESGAAISPSEFENAKIQYFPQIGDSDAVIAQKAANRKEAMNGILLGAAPGFRQNFANTAPHGEVTTAPPQGGGDDLEAQAQAAIAAGADPAKVAARLKQMRGQ